MRIKTPSVLTKYLKKYWMFVVFSVIFSVGHNYMNLQLPSILKSLVNDVIITEDWDYLWQLFRYLVLIFFLSGIFGMLRTFVTQYMGSSIIYNLRDDLYKSLQAHSFRFYDKNRTGDLMSKTTSDVNITRMFLANDLANFMRDIITLILILVMVTELNLFLSLFMFAMVPLLFYLIIWYKRKMFPAYLKMSNQLGTLTSSLQENVTGVRVVKAFGREDYEMEKYTAIDKTYLDSNLDVIKISTNFGPLQELIVMAGSLFLLIFGGYLVMQGDLEMGDLVSFYAFFTLLQQPVKNMALIYAKYSQVEAAMVRINSILKYQDDIKEMESPQEVEDLQGEFKFENISFAYDPAIEKAGLISPSKHPPKNQSPVIPSCNDPTATKKPFYVLKNITFNVQSGERIAILGATGSGKSSLINLIPRFYDPSVGRITVDGYDLKSLKLDTYRRQIGIVSQDIFLFSRTIGENIAFGRKGRTKQQEIEDVAKIACIHNFIISLPDGYKTMVGERGQTLSGGQKQRIAIARALLLEPKILILDDSLSAVDLDTEVQIQQALDHLLKKRTTFVITQRISTVQNCDRILVLDNGQIAELGTHAELFAKNGIYTKIYNTMYKAQTTVSTRKTAEGIPTGVPESDAATEIVIPFKGLSPSDAKVAQAFYTEEFPDEAERQKAELKTLSRIEKYKTQEEKQLQSESDSKSSSESTAKESANPESDSDSTSKEANH